MKVTTKSFVSIILHNLIDWAKCFLATYGEYPSLYDLIDTPKHVLLRLQQHLHNSTFPDPLLPQSRGPPTIQNEPIALQPHLASSTVSIHHVTCLSLAPSISHVTHPSITPSICHADHPSDSLSDSSSPSDHLCTTTPCLSTHPSSTMADHPPVSQQSLPVVNGEQSFQAKKFYWAFPSY